MGIFAMTRRQWRSAISVIPFFGQGAPVRPTRPKLVVSEEEQPKAPKWKWRAMTCRAWTKSEARAEFKRRVQMQQESELGQMPKLKRLPVGESPVRVR